MEFVIKIFLLYLLAINIIAFASYGIDKSRARRGKWRIPECQLLLTALIGGSIGAFLGMRAFHHKTRKAKFFIGVPVIFVLQVIVAFGILGYVMN